MKIRAEQNPARRLEAQGKDRPMRALAGRTTPAGLTAPGALGASGIPEPASLSGPVDRVSVQPRVVLPLQWGEERLDAHLQVVVEPGTGLTPQESTAGAMGAMDPQGNGEPSRGRGRGKEQQVFRLILGLSPPRVGPVQVVLHLREGVVDGELLVADTAAFRAMEQELPRLKESLGRWLTVAGLQVRLLAEARGDGSGAGEGSGPPAQDNASSIPGSTVPGAVPGSQAGGKRHGPLDLHV